MTTTAYATKTAIFALLEAATAVGQPLEGIGVGYAWDPELGLESIYGGGIRFDQVDAVAEHPGILVREVVTISVYVRVEVRPPTAVQETDARAAEIGAWIATVLRMNPNLEGGATWLGITGGAGDYEQTGEGTISILAYQLRTARNITYGGG